MMVTFVSQCEKKAIKRTNRILDAYANRIGDRTWQTVITNEGLDMVKKLLKKSASKNTAVSCHWVRSRSRSHFIWVVGNKRKFNSEGIVPVNYTALDKSKNEERKHMSEIVYANTQKQLLSHHLFAVGYLSSVLIESLLGDNGKDLRDTAFIAGCLHDIGKLDPEYRKWLELKISTNKNAIISIPEDGLHIDKEKFSFDNHPRHNEISLWFLQYIDLSKILPNKKQREFIEYVVYWHHAKPIRKENYTKINDIHRKLKKLYGEDELQLLVNNSKGIVSEVQELLESYHSTTQSINLNNMIINFDSDIADDFRKVELPIFKHYELEEKTEDYLSYITRNAKSNILRSCVITADRIISSLSAEQLKKQIDDGSLELLIKETKNNNAALNESIEDCISKFEKKYPNSKQNEAQSSAAERLLEVESIAVLNGPAGCGKTKIGLEWAKKTMAEKIIWICPRIQVCEGIYEDLTSQEYLSDSKIELLTGELKFINKNGLKKITPAGSEFSGEIVITTIDQIINSIITHTNVTAFAEYLRSHVIFDEYHEYIPMSGFNLLFAELIEAKKMMGKFCNTLLVSATPNYAFVNDVLEIDDEDIIEIKSFNESYYKIKFELFDENIKDETNPIFRKQTKNSIVISNTATAAQLAFINLQTEENSIVFHGKFKAIDKQDIFDKIYDSFKRNGSKKYDVLRSGPIVQAALNITSSNMTTEMTTAENFLQRLGRLDRFGTNNKINEYTIAVPSIIPESNGKIKGDCARFLNSNNTYRSAYAWYEFLQAKLDDKPVQIKTIYALYKDFYASYIGKNAVYSDILSALKESVKLISEKIHDPLQYVSRRKSDMTKKLKKVSLRGDSRFVQMVVMEITSIKDYNITNKYAIQWDESDNDFSNCYTESLNVIKHSGLIDYVATKHGRINSDSPISKIPAKNMALRKQILEAAAIEPKNCIYLSYTPKDLVEKLGEEKPDQSAIYYLHGVNQIIGAMPLYKINEQK